MSMRACDLDAPLTSKFFSEATQLIDDNAPLWAYVTISNNSKKSSGAGGNREWSCNFCQKKVIGSYSRVKAH